MYGSDAIGGVVNLIPESPAALVREDGVSISAATCYSTADDGKGIHLGLAGRHRSLTGLVNLSLKSIGNLRAGRGVGVQDPTGWDEIDAGARLEYALPGHRSLQFDYLAVRQEGVPRYDKYVDGTFDTYVYDPQDRDLAALSYFDGEIGGIVRDWKTCVSFQRESEGRTEQKCSCDDCFFSHDRITTWGVFTQAASSSVSGHVLTYGGEYYRDHVSSEKDLISAAEPEPVRPTYPDGSKYQSAGLFLQDSWSLARALTLILGVRYGYYAIDTPLEEPFGWLRDRFGTLTGSAAASYRPSAFVNIFGSWSRGFRAPNLNDIAVLKVSSSGVDAPSPGVGSEASDNFEIGVKVRTLRYQGGTTIFYNALADLIDRRPGFYGGKSFFDENGDGIQDPTEFDIYQKFNVGSAEIYGFEHDSRVILGNRWQGTFNLFWTRGWNRTEGEDLSRIPPLMGMVALRFIARSSLWFEGYVRAATAQRHLSARDRDDSRIDPDGTPGWATLSLRTQIALGLARMNLSLQNLTDAAYKEHGSGIYSPGRSVSLSIGYGG
jgi:outer membrane receptor protein involved in Fe transport